MGIGGLAQATPWSSPQPPGRSAPWPASWPRPAARAWSGIAGGAEKCRHVVEDLGFDSCVDRRAADWREQLDAATPDGVDVDFENVGGPIMDHVLMRLNIGGRVVLCGMISEYNVGGNGAPVGQQAIAQLIMQRRNDRLPESSITATAS
jgi:NADPH-dependent curcumin reductase CurA